MERAIQTDSAEPTPPDDEYAPRISHGDRRIVCNGQIGRRAIRTVSGRPSHAVFCRGFPSSTGPAVP